MSQTSRSLNGVVGANSVTGVIGRKREMHQLSSCLGAKRNVLIEGPVGVGKTHLAIAVSGELKVPIFRVDGDNRYSEQKLSGWFDPPTVIKKGYGPDSFLPGPLVEAMRQGGVLFINELNRLPEGVQNVLLPAIDERILLIPRLGEIRAHPNFLVIATQNPKEFVATSHLSEAIMDRFELVVLDYQSESEEVEIVAARLTGHTLPDPVATLLPIASVRLIRLTREQPRVRRGASLRAALSVTEIASVMIQNGAVFKDAFLDAALMSLPTRIEIEREADLERSFYSEVEALIREWVALVLNELENPGIKKKP